MSAVVLVDYRERGSKVPEELVKLGASVRYDKLDAADYAVGREVGFERKTCNDFINSIIDRRLFEQCRYLQLTFKKAIVIIEGDLSRVLTFRKVKEPQVYGAIAAIVDMGVNVVFTRDYKDTAMLIYSFVRRLERQTSKPYLQPVKFRVLKSNKGVPVAQLNLVASIPGISAELAHRILLHFKTPRRFFKATSSELRRVKGLGDKRIRKIIEILDTVYTGALEER